MAKSTRKLRERNLEELEDFTEALEDAQDYLENATPFEISFSLSEMGTSTTHQNGIETILEEAANEHNRLEMNPEEVIDACLDHLLDRWKSEIQSKNREYDIDDFALLAQAARYYTIQWFTAKWTKKEGTIKHESKPQ